MSFQEEIKWRASISTVKISKIHSLNPAQITAVTFKSKGLGNWLLAGNLVGLQNP
jgi:hypothetical protein